jgi:hypothetical protein
MNAARTQPAGTLAGLLIIGALVIGCSGTTQNSGPSPQTAGLRPAVETAPADLQLLCAAEAANVYSAPSDKILPTSSTRSSPTTFDVDLDVAGRRARCTIDETGTQITVVDV